MKLSWIIIFVKNQPFERPVYIAQLGCLGIRIHTSNSAGLFLAKSLQSKATHVYTCIQSYTSYIFLKNTKLEEIEFYPVSRHTTFYDAAQMYSIIKNDLWISLFSFILSLL